MVRLRGFVFKPALLPSIAALLVLLLLLALGFWQLDRARQKEDLKSAFTFSSMQPSVPLSALDPGDSASRYRRVTVSGHYDSNHQILLDNQIYQGQPGYHVFTPLKRSHGLAILVNRGWVPLGESRQHLPVIEVTGASLGIEGHLAQPANPGLRLGEPMAGQTTWPMVVQYLDLAAVTKQLGYPVLPAVLNLDPRSQHGYERHWQLNFTGFGPERHRGYAVQWFALALTLIIIYLVVNTRRAPC